MLAFLVPIITTVVGRGIGSQTAADVATGVARKAVVGAGLGATVALSTTDVTVLQFVAALSVLTGWPETTEAVNALSIVLIGAWTLAGAVGGLLAVYHAPNKAPEG